MQFHLADEAATGRLGQDIAMALRPGDLVCLSGGLGAGKSTLARALLRALAGDPQLEVPSPTYTLCQRYDLQITISHFDLYRIASPSELDELGLDEALEAGAALIEWPERGGERLPAGAMLINFEDGPGNSRIALVSLPAGSEFSRRFLRSAQTRSFLDGAFGSQCERRFFQGDASSRRYETVHLDGQTRILMDAPRKPDGPAIRDGKPYSKIARLAEDVVPFIAMAEVLQQAGLAAPQIFARDISAGRLLLEHLGTAKIVDVQNLPVSERYLAAARLLARMHQRQWPEQILVAAGQGKLIEHKVPPYDRDALMIEASLLADWYAPRALGRPLPAVDREEFDIIWGELAGLIEGSMPTLVLRDFHSPNLIWRENQVFPANLGLIDFQDAVIGPQAYDLASLAQDARVDVSRELEAEIIAAYLADRGHEADFDRERLARDYAILAAHRATKILGIFVRLDERDGKPGYLQHLPRMRDYLARNLKHKALSKYKLWCARLTGIAAN